MTDKGVTASEILRDCARRSNSPELIAAEYYFPDTLIDDYSCDMCYLFRELADKIDAELADARELSLLRGAEIWAKANGWPDCREGEDFGAWLARCFIPRPRFEDGEPVQFGELVSSNLFGAVKVSAIEFTEDGTHVKDEPDGDWSTSLEVTTSRLKRPVPEVLGADGKPIKVGETVYRLSEGERLEVLLPHGSTPETREYVDCCGELELPSNLTHERPVLGADGLPIKVGDTVWLADEYSQYADSSGSANGNEYSLFGVDSQEALLVEDDRLVVNGKNYVLLSTCNAWCHASWLTHTQPDTRAAIVSLIGAPSAERIDKLVREGRWLDE